MQAVRGRLPGVAGVPQFQGASTAQRRRRRGMLLSVVLWLMLWGGYNTGIGRLLEPGFPANSQELFHGLRALLPLAAACLAGIVLLARWSLPGRAFRGPLGLLAFYTLVGVISSGLLSREQLTALYWAAEHGAVLVVLWATLAEANPLPQLSRLLSLNWIIVAVLALGMLAGLWFLPGVAPWLAAGEPLGGRPYGGEFGATGEILGMSGTRPTGFGRYAAVAALVALAGLWQGSRRARSIWFVLLLFSMYALVLSQARAAVVAFLPAGFLILWLQRRSKIAFLAATCVALLLLGFTGFYQAFWEYLTFGRPFDPTLTGRTVVWQAGWALFLESPLVGLGFHADRIFLEGAHMHNAFLHALVQTGLLGTIPFVAAFVAIWILILRLYRARAAQGIAALPVEIPALMVFFTIASITESTFAFFGVVWLLGAPCVAYLQVLMRQRREIYD